MHEAVISLFAFCLRSCNGGIGERRVGRQPKPDEQCKCFIPDFNMSVKSLKLTNNPINAPAERRLHTLRSVWRHKGHKRRFDELSLRHTLSRCIVGQVPRYFW